MVKSEKSSSDGPISSGGESPESAGGDTDIVEEDDESCSSDSPVPSSQLSNVLLTSSEAWPLKVNQAIVKKVFGKLLVRDEVIDVLKKKFSVQQKNLTGLTPTVLMSVLAKKLVANKYCKVKEGEVKNLKEDITVLKEIEL